jgi:NAD(P)H-hydrate epimerase
MPLSREQVRSIDKKAIEIYAVPGIVLMENAGRGAVEVLLGLGVTGKVVLCCGKGNNGGDGFVMARHLDNQRIPIHILLLARDEELTGDAAINCQIAARSGLPISAFSGEAPDLSEVNRHLAEADWIVDALYGTGLQGPVRAPIDAVISAINNSGKKVLAVDVPSGLDCDTGLPRGATIRADHTVTFVDAKTGFSRPEALAWLGRVHVVGIGAPRVLIESFGADLDRRSG